MVFDLVMCPAIWPITRRAPRRSAPNRSRRWARADSPRRVFELHVRELLGHLDRRVHVAKGRGEDQVMTRLRQLPDRPLGVRALGDRFEIGRPRPCRRNAP